MFSPHQKSGCPALLAFFATQSRTIYGDTAFAPFGETYANTNTTDPYHFAAYPLDFALGLYDTAAREYHTTQGRWLTPDPAGLSAVDPTNPQSWNRYAYVLNNPMSFTDPTGLMTINPNWYMGFAGGGGNCSLDGVDATCNMVNALAAGGALVYFPYETAHTWLAKPPPVLFLSASRTTANSGGVGSRAGPTSAYRLLRHPFS